MFKKFRKTLVAVAATAMAMAAMAIGADANYNGYEDGTYTVTANLYVPRAEAPFHLFNAYFTSDDIPPRTEKSGNATLEVNSNGLFLTVPVTNSGLALKSIGTYPDGISLTGSATDAISCSDESHAGIRYTSLTFKLTPSSYNSTLNYTLSNCASHAKIALTVIDGIEITATDTELSTSVEVEITGLSVAKEES